MIFESNIVTATTADLLSTGRLNAIPYNGTLTLRFISQFADATNSYSVTIQKPNGDVPVDAQLVPAVNPALAGVMDERHLLQFTFGASQGGHFTVTLTETGTAVAMFQAILKP